MSDEELRLRAIDSFCHGYRLSYIDDDGYRVAWCPKPGVYYLKRNEMAGAERIPRVPPVRQDYSEETFGQPIPDEAEINRLNMLGGVKGKKALEKVEKDMLQVKIASIVEKNEPPPRVVDILFIRHSVERYGHCTGTVDWLKYLQWWIRAVIIRQRHRITDAELTDDVWSTVLQNT